MRRVPLLLIVGCAAACFEAPRLSSESETETDGSASSSTSRGSTGGSESSSGGEAPSSGDADTAVESSDGAGDTEASTGGQPACCDASCSTCGNDCQTEALDHTDDGEALAIAVVGTTLYWTTGYAREVFALDLTSGESSLLATVPEVISHITTDDSYLYYLSFFSGFVGRVDLTSGAQVRITDANLEGATPLFEAGYGHLVVDESNVYFALGNSGGEGRGGAFLAPKTPNPDIAPNRIGTLERTVGIGIDEDSVYVSDAAAEALFRFDKGNPTDSGVQLAELGGAGPIHVTPTDIYAAAGGSVVRVSKEGGAPELLTTTGGEIRGLAADEAHLYASDVVAGSVTRVSLLDADAPLEIAISPGAWGIATDCGAVYWCENDTLTVRRRPK